MFCVSFHLSISFLFFWLVVANDVACWPACLLLFVCIYPPCVHVCSSSSIVMSFLDHVPSHIHTAYLHKDTKRRADGREKERWSRSSCLCWYTRLTFFLLILHQQTRCQCIVFLSLTGKHSPRHQIRLLVHIHNALVKHFSDKHVGTCVSVAPVPVAFQAWPSRRSGKGYTSYFFIVSADPFFLSFSPLVVFLLFFHCLQLRILLYVLSILILFLSSPAHTLISLHSLPVFTYCYLYRLLLNLSAILVCFYWVLD